MDSSTMRDIIAPTAKLAAQNKGQVCGAVRGALGGEDGGKGYDTPRPAAVAANWLVATTHEWRGPLGWVGPGEAGPSCAFCSKASSSPSCSPWLPCPLPEIMRSKLSSSATRAPPLPPRPQVPGCTPQTAAATAGRKMLGTQYI